ncbi:MAG: tRNA lysidine(34) synthetase TilS, partial [Caldilineaceae bacterium]|nr:tRNA lysidine(34) synthetase TilS [Caldilineaceae bacterium]
IGDLFTDRKIPTELRPHWPLLVDATTGEVHWVCGLQPGHRARITAATEEVLAVHFAQVDPDM